MHGARGVRLGHVLIAAEEVLKFVVENARTQHLHTEEETAKEHLQSQ